MLRMIRQSRIENLRHFFVLGEIAGNDAAAAVVLLHSNSESLHSTQNQPALKWRQNRARAFLQKRQFFRLLRFGANHNAAETVAVPIEKFRGGVNDHIRAELNRLLEIWRHEW